MMLGIEGKIEIVLYSFLKLPCCEIKSGGKLFLPLWTLTLLTFTNQLVEIVIDSLSLWQVINSFIDRKIGFWFFGFHLMTAVRLV